MLMTVFPPEQALEFVLLDEYNKGVEAGEARGLELGEKRGMELGEKRGLELGKKCGLELGAENEKIKIAKDMKKEGLESGFIMKLTGLSKEAVETL